MIQDVLAAGDATDAQEDAPDAPAMPESYAYKQESVN